MSNLYQLTAEIHKLVQEKAEKYGLTLQITGDRYFQFETNIKESKIFAGEAKEYVVIQPPQIRQILVAFEKVLGENPEYKEYLLDCQDYDEDSIIREYAPCQSQAQALCQHWLDGLEPLFDREPETVLTELLEVLKSL